RAVRRVRRDPVGRLRLRRAHVRAEAVADCGRLPLGAVLPETRQGGDERLLEDRLLLRQPQGRLRRARPLWATGLRRDEGGDRDEEGWAHQRQLLRVQGPVVRPERDAARQARAAAVGEGPVRGELARQGRHRESEGLDDSRGGSRALPPRPLMPAAVTLRGITKRFPGVVANDGVDFEAAEGEVHALLGENGAGKSTLSNILTGLYRPDEGEIFLYGEPVAFHSPRDSLEAGVCMVHQHFLLVPPFTVAE